MEAMDIDACLVEGWECDKEMGWGGGCSSGHNLQPLVGPRAGGGRGTLQ